MKSNPRYRGTFTPLNDVELMAMNQLLTDVILGRDFLEKHQHITITFGGELPPCIKTKIVPRLFEHLINPNCKPIAAPSRKQSVVNKKMTEETV